ncbi:MAG: VWA domain-containing protein [Opitutaceae bacterium]
MPRFPRFTFLRSTRCCLLLASTALAPSHAAPAAAPADGIALAVVFDTSGSMRASLATKPGSGADAKYLIAQRAFGTVIDRLDAFTKSPSAKPLSVGVYIFRGNDAVVALPLAPFHAARLKQWLAAMHPDGSTPLGDAIFLAARDLLATNAASRHILVLTDGANTVGRTPEAALEKVTAAALAKQTPVFTHIIALDIAPKVFAALQKQGATLIGAADESQLNAQFDFILEEKILVEAPR